jgi:catechol 2,3-dioxygenase-like lactoylglutathione lyase family enzyme
MITGLDHVVILVADIAAGAAAYETLFARSPAWRNSGDGAERVLFTLDNMTLELMSPSGDGATADRIRRVIAEQGEGLASLCFRTDDIARMHRRLERLSLKPEPVTEAESRDATSGATLSWKRTRAATDATHGVRLFFLELAKERPLSVRTAASITAMDHVVAGPDPTRRRARRRAAWLDAGSTVRIGWLADVLPLRRSRHRGRIGRAYRRHTAWG